MSTETAAKPENPWLQMHSDFKLAPIDYLYNKLQAIYGASWRLNFPSEWHIRAWRITWADGLLEAGITKEQLKSGIRHCEQNTERPPVLPEFIATCRIVTPPAHRDFPKLSRKLTEDEKEIGRGYIRILHRMIDEKMKEKEQQRQEKRL